MKGLVCEYSGYKTDHKKEICLCVSEVHQFGVNVVNSGGHVTAINPDNLKVIKPQKIPPIFDDWRVQMGFESWNNLE